MAFIHVSSTEILDVDRVTRVVQNPPDFVHVYLQGVEDPVIYNGSEAKEVWRVFHGKATPLHSPPPPKS